MKVGTIYHDGKPAVARVWRAATTWENTRGLLGHPRLQQDEGMLITACRLVHTFGMAYPLDLAFLDRHGRVCKTVAALKPARMAGSLAARDTLELAPGTLARLGVKTGDTLEWREDGR